MALVFRSKAVGTAKLQESNATTFISTAGVNPNEASPATYATQINKILAIGGKSVVANTHTTVTQVREVIDDGE